jgi:hypothetical protein
MLRWFPGVRGRIRTRFSRAGIATGQMEFEYQQAIEYPNTKTPGLGSMKKDVAAAKTVEGVFSPATDVPCDLFMDQLNRRGIKVYETIERSS